MRALFKTSAHFASCLGVLLSAGLIAACNGDPEPQEEGACTPDSFHQAEARLLTRSEYRRTVRDLLGTELDPTGSFPPEPVVGGFENDASSHQANPLLVEKHANAAKTLADELLQKGIPSLYECSENEDQACAEEFIEWFGGRAFRRPLKEGETSSFVRLYRRAAPTIGHEEALATVVEAALQAPQFLYRVEAPIAERSGEVIALGPYEIASRLSYFLWGTMPDEELLEAAQDGSLSEKAGVEAQARRLLAADRAKSRAREFHSQWLGLSRLGSIARNDSPEGAASAWNESTQRFIEEILWSDEPLVSHLFSSASLHYDAALASLYGLEAPESWTQSTDMAHRHGLLTQPGIMALFAHADQSSPIQRGVFVRESILCEEVEPPPPTVDNNPPDPDPSLTTRERFAVHTESPQCARCHELIDPLGFGFESYDHLGRFRTEENGLPIDTSGSIVEVEEDALEGDFDGATELSVRLSQSETILTCLARKWFTFAMGRGHTARDDCSIDSAVGMSHDADGNLHELLIALATSDAFRFRAAHESDGGAEP